MKRNVIIIISILFIFLILALMPTILISLVGNFWYQYLFRPLIWFLIAIAASFLLRDDDYQINYNRSDLRQFALIGSLVYIILYFLIGLAIGYSKSPISHEPIGFLSNFISFLVIAVMEEIIRYRYIKTISGKEKWLVIILVTIVLALLNMRLTDFLSATTSVSSMVTFMCKSFLPATISSIFLTYLIYREGIVSAYYYKIPFLLVYLISPVLPSNNYALLCFITSLVPLIIYLKIETEYFTNVSYNLKQHLDDPREKIRLTVFTVFIAFITLFTMGFFSVSPVVVITGSMDPAIKKGDIVIYQKIDYEKIEIDDVIVYNLNKIAVIHRVKLIQTDSLNGKVLTTKGDNNKSEDPRTVSEDQLKGRVIAIIPKAGYPTIWLRELLNKVEEEVEIETGD